MRKREREGESERVRASEGERERGREGGSRLERAGLDASLRVVSAKAFVRADLHAAGAKDALLHGRRRYNAFMGKHNRDPKLPLPGPGATLFALSDPWSTLKAG